jgi:alpha-glucosidase
LAVQQGKGSGADTDAVERWALPGFSSAVPWLPVNPEYPVLNVDRQEGDEKSLLSFTRKLIRLRREHPALARSMGTTRYGKDGLLSYARIEGSERIVVLLNSPGKRGSFQDREIL